jgi:uncharacterized protein
MMEGIYLRVFTTAKQKHNGKLLYEWLLEQARSLGVQGGSALRAIAGYGRHGKLHEETFFELADDMPVEVVFMMQDAQAERFLDFLAQQKLSLFYIKTRAEFGVIGEA